MNSMYLNGQFVFNGFFFRTQPSKRRRNFKLVVMMKKNCKIILNIQKLARY